MLVTEGVLMELIETPQMTHSFPDYVVAFLIETQRPLNAIEKSRPFVLSCN